MIFFSSRGFGFVTFSDASAVNEVLAKGPHTLDQKTVSCKEGGYGCVAFGIGHYVGRNFILLLSPSRLTLNRLQQKDMYVPTISIFFFLIIILNVALIVLLINQGLCGPLFMHGSYASILQQYLSFRALRWYKQSCYNLSKHHRSSKH